MRHIRDLKKSAKQAMKGHTGMLILAMAVYTLLGFVGNRMTELFFPGNALGDIIVSEIFLFVLTLIFGVFYSGVRYLYLKVARGQEYSMEDLIYFFRHDPDKAIIVTFVPSVISLLVSLPVNIYFYNYADMGTTPQEQMEWAMMTLMLMLLVLVVTELLTLPLELIYYLLGDHPEMSGTEVLNQSIRILKGNLGRLLLLKISFIPMMLLSVFTLYLALLWIIPYMEMTTAEFYRELLGELDENISF